MKHLPFPGRRREGEYLPGTGNSVPGAGGLRREQEVPACQAGRVRKGQYELTPRIHLTAKLMKGD